ncbi:MAG: cytochrome c peroxidase [Sediminicola sp.]
MKKTIVIVLFALVLSACKHERPNEKPLAERDLWSDAQAYYVGNMAHAILYMDSLAMVPPNSKEAKSYFKQLRSAFKKAEPYASYLKPAEGHRVNGPALPILTEDTQKILLPFGLQKIEESIYDGIDTASGYERELSMTRGLMVILRDYIPKRGLTPERFFIATHQQLMRIISLGISGFDTPVSHLGLNETKISLQSLLDVYKMSIQPIIKGKENSLDQDLNKNITAAISFIGNDPDFETFDRYTFLRDYMNPITRSWTAIRKASGLWEGAGNQPYNFDAPTFFEEDSFNVEYFTPVTNKNPSKERIELGKKLFFEKKLSKSGDMACVTCHDPKKAWADGIVANRDKNGKMLARNTPTLINSSLQRTLFWDGRSPDLISQISTVFNNENEFDSSVHQFSDGILADSTYVGLFRKAYGGIYTRNTDIIRAISSYITTLNGFSSKFDKNIRGEEDTYTQEEKLGFNLFMGKGLCATCHFIPLTNGTVPPFFSEHEKEVIGVPKHADNKSLDDDEGFYFVNKNKLQWGMFKTPTIRNVGLTAPYMHNGAYTTLEEVVNFYNMGGGAGLGFDLPYQTLPFDELKLTKAEEAALVAFMETLTDVPKEKYY